jgi:hypothetical protein
LKNSRRFTTQVMPYMLIIRIILCLWACSLNVTSNLFQGYIKSIACLLKPINLRAYIILHAYADYSGLVYTVYKNTLYG